MTRRRFRFHLIGPAPYGGTFHTADRHDVARAIAAGYRLYRLNPIPPRYWRAVDMTDTRPLVLLDCEHGPSGYRAGCRCGTCKQGNTQRAKLYRDAGTSADTAQRGRPGRPNRRDAAPDRGWMAHAPCRGADPDLFYSTRDEDSSPEVYREARRVCASCPYRAACLDYAIETRETHGLWGGLSPKQRRAEIARRRTASATETRKANNAADRAARIAAAGITP